MKDLKISFEYSNLDELKVLLQKAINQVEQLQKTLKEIEKFKTVTKRT
ncbi:MAG: hypothetical protein RR595_05600 [Lysinibacillus sp.]